MKKKKKNILVKKGANFFGFEEVGLDGKKKHKLFVARGNGTLSLDVEGVTFRRWLPPKKFFIPMGSIVKLDVKRSHNLKTKLLPVLRIHYKEEGKIKIFGVCIGFLDETHKWRDEIAKIRGSYLHRGEKDDSGGHLKS